jgi:hypothetical protein
MQCDISSTNADFTFTGGNAEVRNELQSPFASPTLGNGATFSFISPISVSYN